MKSISIALIVLAASFHCHAATFELDGYAAALKSGGKWTKFKDEGRVVEYPSNGSKYRTFEPTVSPTPEGGILITTKLNHIRRFGGDDHCILRLKFDKDGKPLEQHQGTLKMGDKSFDFKILMTGAAAPGITVKAAAAVAVAKQIHDQLAGLKDKLSEKGGRENFPNVIEHNFNHIISHVKP